MPHTAGRARPEQTLLGSAPRAPSPVSALATPSRVLPVQFGRNSPCSRGRPLPAPSRGPRGSHAWRPAGQSPPGGALTAGPALSSLPWICAALLCCLGAGPTSCPKPGVHLVVSALQLQQVSETTPRCTGSERKGCAPLRSFFCSEDGGGLTPATLWMSLGNSSSVEVMGRRKADSQVTRSR